MNENFVVQISGISFLVRLSKFADGVYGNKLNYEFQILQSLLPYQITPKAFFYGKMGEWDVLIEEFLDGKQLFVFDLERNKKISKTIKTLQEVSLSLDFIPKVDTLANYVRKYSLWLSTSKNTLLKWMWEQVITTIEKNAHHYQGESFVLCHNDLRLDNAIINDEKAYLIDLEWMTYGNQYVDVAGYYSGNLFFERFGLEYKFSHRDLLTWCQEFFKDTKQTNKTLFLIYLQFFSDLCWLDNYLQQHSEEEKKLSHLFEKNLKFFENDLSFLSKALEE